MLLAQILHLQGIETVVLERQSRAYVLGRIRAGLLEWGTVETLRSAGVGERRDRDGDVHDGAGVARGGNRRFYVDTYRHVRRSMMAYGQTQTTEDLYAARDAIGGVVIDEAADVGLHDVDSKTPSIITISEAAMTAMCEQYAGLPYE